MRGRESERETSASPLPWFRHKECKVQFRPRQKEERRPHQKPVTFIQARRGDSQPNNQAECKRDQGGFIFKGRFVEVIRETLVRWDVLGILQLRWRL